MIFVITWLAVGSFYGLGVLTTCLTDYPDWARNWRLFVALAIVVWCLWPCFVDKTPFFLQSYSAFFSYAFHGRAGRANHAGRIHTMPPRQRHDSRHGHDA